MKVCGWALFVVLNLASVTAAAAVGDSTVCKWKDDRTGVFLLMFDDVLASHPEVVAPALAERNMRATFYTVPNNWGASDSAYMKMWKDYEANVACGNHTWDHKLPSGPVPTATAGTDYTDTNGTLTWAANDSTVKTFTVPIKGDTESENDEFISLVLSNATGGAVLGALPTAKISIIDDDAPGGFIAFKQANYSVNEGASGTTNTATIWVTRTGGSTGAVSVNYNTDFSGWTPHYRGTANGWPTADDYIVTSGTLNWAPGETADKSFFVKIRGDANGEADETVTLMLSNPQGGARLKTALFLDTPSAATLTIVNDDPVPNGVFEFSAPTYSVTEGDSGTKNVTISVERVGGALEMAKVKVETIAGGTATPGSDYVEKSQELQWQANDMNPKTFTIAVKGDTIGETAETVFIKMSLVWPHKGFVSTNDTAILTINDNDSAPAGILEFSQATYSVTERNSGTTNLTISVRRVGGSANAVSVQYATGIGDTPVIEQLLDIIQREQMQPAQDAILESNSIPGRSPRLISFAMPGTNPAYYWPKLFYDYRSDYDRLMPPNNLVNRPPFGASRAASTATDWVNTVAEALAIADIAIATGEMEYLNFHGLKSGEPFWFGNWNGTTNPMFNEVLDGLKTHMDNGRLWVTDHVSWHQYEQQRLGAVITTLENSPTRIRLKVTDNVDDVLYNHPLTLKTQVPSGWATVRVTQGGVTNVRQVVAGEVMYDVASNGTEITLFSDDIAPPATQPLWDGGGANNGWNTAANWAGDTVPAFPSALTFGGTTRLAPSNNLSGITVTGLTFTNGAGSFVLGGNAFTLSGDIVNQDDSLQTVNNDLTLAATQTVTSTGSGSITLGGVLSGSGGITKNGSRTLTLSGATANTYSGLTTVNSGTLELSKAAWVTAIAGDLVIGDGTGTDTVKLLAANQIASTNLTLNAGGVLDMNGATQWLIRLLGTGTVDNTSATPGTMILLSDTDATFNGAITQSGGGAVTVSKRGGNTVTLGGSGSTFTGPLSVYLGTLEYTAPGALGNGTAIQLGNAGAGGGAPTLSYSTAGATPSGLSARTITINANGPVAGNIRNDSVNSAAALTIGAVTTLGTTAKTLTLGGTNTGTNTVSGVIANGASGLSLIKADAGTWVLSNANTYTGATTVAVGTLSLAGASHASPITVNSGAFLGLSVGTTVASSATLTLDAGAKITVSGTPTLASYTLLNASAITGTPELASAIPGYTLVKDGNVLKLNAFASNVQILPNDPLLAFRGVMFPTLTVSNAVLNRFTAALVAGLPSEQLRGWARCQSGVVVSFRTASPNVTVNFAYRPDAGHMAPPWTQQLYAVYRDGIFLANHPAETTSLALQGTGATHTWDIVLPIVYGIHFTGLGLDAGHDLVALAPETLPAYVAIGDSITQGFGELNVSLSSAMTYPWKLAAANGWRLYNLGIGGSWVTPAVADGWPTLNPTIITVLWGYNDWNSGTALTTIQQQLTNLVVRLRAQQPNARIYGILQTATTTVKSPSVDELRQAQRQAFESLINAGDQNLFVLDGSALTDTNDLADTVHLSVAGAERFAARLSTAINAGSLQFTSATYAQTEGNTGTTQAVVTVSRSGGSNGVVSLSFATADGTAVAGSDYTATNGTLTWASGESGSKSFAVNIAGDTLAEPDETVLLTLAAPTGGATLGTPATAVLTITNDDVSVPISGATKYWDGAGTWTDANSWSLTSGGPYDQSWASGDAAVFDVAGTITAATATFKSITVNQNVTWTAGGTLSTTGTATVIVAATKTLNTAAQTWGATSSFIKDGAGLWVMQGGSYTGNFTMNAGTIAMANPNALGGSSGSRTLTLNGGQIRSNGATDRDLGTRFGGGIIIGGDIALGAAAPTEGAMSFSNNITLGAATRKITTDGTVNLSGVISGDAGAGLTKAGVGTLTLSGTNTYSGPTSVTGGILRLTNPQCLSTNTDLYLYTGATNNLNFKGTNVIRRLYVNGVWRQKAVYGADTLPSVLTGIGYLRQLNVNTAPGTVLTLH
jgi:autotransporter-associated beta strand protein